MESSQSCIYTTEDAGFKSLLLASNSRLKLNLQIESNFSSTGRKVGTEKKNSKSIDEIQS